MGDMLQVANNVAPAPAGDQLTELNIRAQVPSEYLEALSYLDAQNRSAVRRPLGIMLKSHTGRPLHLVVEIATCRCRAIATESEAHATAVVESGQLLPRIEVSAELDERLAALTPREDEVMRLLVLGKSQKQIAGELGITIQTAAKHRAKVLHKLRVGNDVELVRLTLTGECPAAEGSDR